MGITALADTTIRLLGQEPLSGRMPTGELLQLAEILDGAGFASLEVSGGGVFDSAVKRGVESPWERIRAIKARTKTPLGLALRGRFLVGSRPVDGDFVRRFVACAAENGIDVFRLHDPLNDISNLTEAAEAIAAAGGSFEAGLVYGSGLTGETEALVGAGAQAAGARRRAGAAPRPDGLAAAAPRARARGGAPRGDRAARSGSTARAPRAARSRPCSRPRVPVPTSSPARSSRSRSRSTACPARRRGRRSPGSVAAKRSLPLPS